MTSAVRPTFGGCYAMLAGVGLAVAGVTLGVAWAAVGRESGASAAVIAGCAASWLASCVGAVPVAWGLSTAPQRAGSAVMTATALRFLVVLALAAPMLLVNWVPRAPFVACLAVSYLLILLTDSFLTVRMIRRYSRTECS